MNKVSGHYLSSIVNACIALGVSNDLISEKFKFSQTDLSDTFKRFDGEVLLDLYKFASTELNEPNIGLKVGAKFNPSWLNETGKLLPFCATLGEAGFMIGRYHRLTQSFGTTNLYLDDNLKLDWQPNYDDIQAYSYVIEVIFSGMVLASKWLLWNAGDAIKYVHFRHKANGPIEDYENLLGCSVQFNCDVDQIGVDSAFLQAPIVTSNPEIKVEMCRKLDRLLLRLSDETALIARVEASIREQLHDASPQFSVTAEHLAIEERSLRYKLKRQAMSFRAIVEAVRREICEVEMRKDTQLSVIAQRLCFHDQSAFNHAFHKWYGMSPKQYQLSQVAALGAK